MKMFIYKISCPGLFVFLLLGIEFALFSKNPRSGIHVRASMFNVRRCHLTLQFEVQGSMLDVTGVDFHYNHGKHYYYYYYYYSLLLLLLLVIHYYYYNY